MHTSWYQPTTILTKLSNPQDQPILWYGDFWPLWWVYKPHGLATTLGKQVSLVDILCTTYHKHPLIAQALETFWVEDELGMLTRLDNDTAGMVWFAHDHETKTQWLHDQPLWHIHKIYEADVVGRVHDYTTVDVPVMHHRYDDRLMITWVDWRLGRWYPHHVSTRIVPGAIQGNHTHIQAIIHQWCRHQIRVHCSHYGTPIIWDILYHKQHTDSCLHLWSVGIDRNYLTQPVVVDYHIYQ